MKDLQDQAKAIWQQQTPDLVIADFVVPVAGLLAQQMQIPWWTGIPTPCALETGDGVPSYLGGWSPNSTWRGRWRDYLGRKTVRGFKRISAAVFAGQLAELGIHGLYRSDGSEAIYSPERILAYGMREFEFQRNWPDCLQFIGPLSNSPITQDTLTFPSSQPRILISLGTHLDWAKDDAIRLMRQVADLCPEWTFYFSRGRPGLNGVESSGNFHLYEYLPYTNQLAHFSAAVIHGGTGITYACIDAGVPMLVWPMDYDQFDHASRIVHHGLGRRLRPKPKAIVDDLRLLIDRPEVANDKHKQFQSVCRRYHPTEQVGEFLSELKQRQK